ncbi:hypothetical protein, partial [Acinetobacter haemolyticus]|uniref:hypothetical protein n=1 Tax=Acinetobacter haemolyticus TaxID=29430 RepID=UPI0021CD38AA
PCWISLKEVGVKILSVLYFPFPETTPNGFGYLHILRNHGQEFNRLRPPTDVFGFLVKKLGQGGSFHHQTDKRKGLYLAMLPSGVIILDYVAKGRDSFFTIITAYTTNRSIDGKEIGRYISTFQVKPKK